jgi:phosphate transport system substrate-binding protein
MSMPFLADAPGASASPARINGGGSTYVGLAMQQWVADAQTRGLSVNYLPSGSPQGLSEFGDNLIDFAGTEAEYSALGGTPARRGYQYTPDVAGAIAIMYHAQDKAGRNVDYLHLTPVTVARIFMGDISSWADPAITADNGGLQLPDQPITVVYRGGQSGTTALFYDFIQHTDPSLFATWAAKNQLPTQVRIIQLDSAPHFAPAAIALSGSDQIAQSVAGPGGLWEIAYDEFGYAKVYGAQAAWIKNASGASVQPFAQNISAALESATLRPDLSQELSGVYASKNPLAYPISAYSYLVTQCAPSPARASCLGGYLNSGVAQTLALWMRYIACEGQVNMSRIGYSPLPPNLSQELVNSIARMQGTVPETLTAANCANPRFAGNLGGNVVAPKDPLAGRITPSSNPATNHTTGPSSQVPGSAGGTATNGGAVATSGAGGAVGVIGGASQSDAAGVLPGVNAATRDAAPVAYNRPFSDGRSLRPLVLLVALLALPLVVYWLRRLR